MSRRIQSYLFLFLACFSLLILSAPDAQAVREVELEDIYPGGGCPDCPPPDDEGGDPEEILIRSRPAPPVDNRFEFAREQDSSIAWLVHLVNLVRTLR